MINPKRLLSYLLNILKTLWQLTVNTKRNQDKPALHGRRAHRPAAALMSVSAGPPQLAPSPVAAGCYSQGMLTLREAFTLGYLPAAMGAYWNSVALLVRIAEQPDDANLRRRLQQREAALREQELTLSEDLMQVDALLRKLGQQMPSLPRLAPDYTMWYGAILETTHQKLQLTSPEAAKCLVAGLQLGESWEMLSLAWLTYYFLTSVPDQPLLRAQSAVLGRSQKKVRRRTQRLINEPQWTPPQRQILVELDEAFSKLPNLDLEEAAEPDSPTRLRAIVTAMEVVAVRLRAFPSMLPNTIGPVA